MGLAMLDEESKDQTPLSPLTGGFLEYKAEHYLLTGKWDLWKTNDE